VQTRVAAMILLALLATVAYAQDRGSELRTVQGVVLDKQETPIDSAVVYLKNTRTQDVKTYIANRGQFRFSGLDPNVDYEIHAEFQESASAVRTISSYDTRKTIVVTLKLDHKRNPR